MPPLYIHDAPPCSSIHMSEPNRAVCLFLHFELLDECSAMRRHRRHEGVVLVLEALPNCGEPNASIASGIELAFRSTRMGPVTVLNYVPTDPIIDAVGCLSRGDECRHGGASLELLGPPAEPADDRLTLELNC